MPSNDLELLNEMTAAVQEAKSGADDILVDAVDDEPEPESALAAEDAPAPEASDDAPPAEPVETPAKPAEDEFAKEHGITQREPSGRENRIPYSRVRTIADNAIKKATVKIQQELGTLKEHNSTYVERLQRIGETERIMFSEPERFLGMLEAAVPGYKELLAARRGSASNGSQPGGTPDATAGGEIDWSKAPAADTDSGYSPQGLQSLLTWTVQQAAAAAEAKVSKRYGDMEKDWRTHREVSTRKSEQQQRINSTLGDAMQWRGFRENHNAILKVLQEDSAQARANGTGPSLTLRAAYEHVVFGRHESEREKLSTDRAAIRAEVMSELAKAPVSTSVAASGGGKVSPVTADMSVDDEIRHALRKAGIRG